MVEGVDRHGDAVLGESSVSTVRRVTGVGMVANLGLAALKAGFGAAAHSQALIADAVHSLSDCVTDTVVLVGVHFWSLPPDERHPHGHRRIETLVTAVIGVLLGMVGVGLGWRALSSVGTVHEHGPGWAAFGAAVVSIVVKEAMFRWTAWHGQRVHSSSMVANAWHHRSDALSSVPVALAVLVDHIWPGMGYVDQVAAVLVSWLLVRAAWKIAAPAFGELIDEGASQAARARMEELALSVDGVLSLHALRTRRSGPGYQVDLHVQVDGSISVREGHDIAKDVRHRLHEGDAEVIDVLVHVEPALDE
jgi:cation diffusion facilitator family transporter